MRLRGAILLVAACATAKPSPRAQFEVERSLLREGDEARNADDLSLAREKYRAAIASPDFQTLDSPSQHRVLQLAAQTELDLHRDVHDFGTVGEFLAYVDALHDYARRLTAMPEATLDDWKFLLWQGDRAEQVKALTRIAWLEGLAGVKQDEILEVVRRRPESSQEADALLQLELALLHARWTLDSGAQPAWVWYQLAASLLERGDLQNAAEAASRIDSGWIEMQMRADKRFDRLALSFDVKRSFAEDIARRRELAQQHPRSLQARVALIEGLKSVHRYGEALALSDVALGEKFDDEKENRPWLRNAREEIFWRLGRYEEGIAELLEEQGDVSQQLNLAECYVKLGDVKHALPLLADPGDKASPFGQMARQEIRAKAGVVLHDPQLRDDALAYLRAHREDGMEPLQSALTAAGFLDEAAAVLIARLEDPRLRGEALLSVQNVPDAKEPDVAQEWIDDGKRLPQRPDVRAEIEKVGRIESWDFEQ